MDHHSVAVVFVLMVMMMVGWSNCTMSDIGSTAAGNSTAVASSAWCNGKIEDGQCMLDADAAAYGEHLNLDVMDMVLQYFDSSEISRRVLATGAPNTYVALNPGKHAVPDETGKYGTQQAGGCHASTYKKHGSC